MVKGRMHLSIRRVFSDLEPYRDRNGRYSFPVCGDIYKRLIRYMPDLEVDEDLKFHLRYLARRQRRALELSTSEDAPGREDLYPYQRVAVAWLSAVKRGILADEQGLGKTVMAAVAAREANPKRGVVICGRAKRKDWAEHIEQWTGADVTILEGTPGQRAKLLTGWKSGYLVTTYSTACIEKSKLIKSDLVIVDECHTIRNRKNATSEMLRSLSSKAEWVFLLTASPTVNSISDLWTLLSICDPKRFSSYWGFVFRFCAVADSGYGLHVGGLKNEEERVNLENIVRPYMLTRSGMLDLPEPTYRDYPYRMTGEQEKLYDQMDQGNAATWGEQTVEALLDVSLITRLRQLALHPGLTFPGYAGPSKLDVLPDLVREREGKVVMFTHYADLAKMAAEHLNGHDISASYLTGGLTGNQQQEVLENFRQGPVQVMVVTHGTGGEGLNLVEADRVVFLEQAWHPAGNKHALSRVLRHGQESDNVEIIFVRTASSVEDHINDIVLRKEEVTIEAIMARRNNKEE